MKITFTAEFEMTDDPDEHGVEMHAFLSSGNLEDGVRAMMSQKGIDLSEFYFIGMEVK